MLRHAIILCALVALLLGGGNPAEAAKLHRLNGQQINAPAPATVTQVATEPAVPAEKPAEKQEGAATAETSHEAAAEEGSGGLPQLDFARFPGQLFWFALTFILTYLLMRNVALPGVEETLGNREKRISADIGGSKAKNEAAKHLMAEYETRLARARTDAMNATRSVTEENNAKAAEALKSQGDKINAQIRSAEARITEQKTAAITALDAEVASVVEALIKSVSNISPAKADIEAAIRKARSQAGGA